MRKLLFLLAITAILSSCANERKFVRFQYKNNGTAAKYCGVWYPAKDSIHERITYKPGETILIPGETKYADCDSAYIAALDEAARTGKHIVVQRVAVPCPPSTITHDTVDRVKVVYQENTALVTSQAADIAYKTKQADQYKAGFQKWRSRAVWAGIIIGLEVIALILWLVFKIKGSVI